MAKIKIKTKRAAAKRFKLTGTGKVRFHHSNHRHNLTSKPKAAKLRHRKGGILAKGDSVLVKEMIPYA